MRNRTTLTLLVALILISIINIFMCEKDTVALSELLFEGIESLADNSESGAGSPTCAAGGCNAKSCSFNGQIEVLGNGVTYSNSVECEGAWACCYTTAYCFSKDKC